MLTSMNIYTAIILSALLVSYALEIISGLLTLGSLKNEPPEELQDVFDPILYRKSQEYTRERLQFGFVCLTVRLLVVLGFWFLGGFNLLDLLLRSFGWPELITGIVYISILVFGMALVNLPFIIYATFVIEEKFGFNKMTLKVFLTDIIKWVVLGILIWLPLLMTVLWLFEVAGPAAWLLGWLSVTMFVLFIQFFVLNWILPIFSKLIPLKDEALKQMILNYLLSVKFSLKDILVIDATKRTGKMNAFFIGIRENIRIVLVNTMLAKFSKEEIVAIIAHEVGHYKQGHIIKKTILKVINMGLMFYLISIFIGNQDLFKAFRMTYLSNYAGLVFFGMLYTPIKMILTVGMNALSRKYELAADLFSAKTTGRSDALITALKKLTANNLTNLTPHPMTVFLYYSHPPLRERVKALKVKTGE